MKPQLLPGWGSLSVMWAALLTAVLPAMAQGDGGDGPVIMDAGQEVATMIMSPAITEEEANFGEAPVWTYVIEEEGAAVVTPHFLHLDLPEGAWVVLSDPALDEDMNARQRTYTAEDLQIEGREEGGWGIPIPGDSARIQLFSRQALGVGAVTLDRYSFISLGGGGELEALCGPDDSRWARCYQSTEPEAYRAARSVLRLFINGRFLCTGWLVGNEGHVMTNHHCISSQSEASNTTFEAMAERGCSVNCTGSLSCPGPIVAERATLIKKSANLDYALLKLPVNPTPTYGYLQMRAAGATLGEQVYLAHHPGGMGKRIGLESTDPADPGGFVQVTSLNEPRCAGVGHDIGYYGDTQGGSSGSPVMGYVDDQVVALHHCGSCPNRGVPIEKIINHLGSDVPDDAVSSVCSDPCPHGGTFDGNSCYMGAVPGGAPFIWNSRFFHKPVNSSLDHCPGDAYNRMAGTFHDATFDSANCYLDSVPGPFIYNESFYYRPACKSCSNPCPNGGHFDGNACYLYDWPGVTPFIYQNGWYYNKMPNRPDGPCPYDVWDERQGQWRNVTFDGSNCRVGVAGPGTKAFIWGNNYYQSPVCKP